MSARRRSSGPAPDPPGDASEELPFEAALERLEQIVDRLERGDLELEGALAAFEQGVGLARRCAQQLDDAERRIAVLVREGGGLVERAFEESDEGGEVE